jgi:general secretion pathway protein D
LSPTAHETLEKAPFAGKDKQRIVLNFEKADVSEVTNVIFQDYLKVNYVLDPALQGRISMYLEGDFSKEELFQLVAKAYEANNLSVSPRKGIYYIQPIQRSSSSSLPIATNFLLKEGQNGARPMIVMYRLRFMDVKQAVTTIKFFLTPSRPITSDPMTNSVIFVEDADNARSIVDVLKALDINVLQEVSMEIVPLQAISPQDAAQGMEALIGKLDAFKESALKSNVAVIPLLNYGGVLLLAHNPEVLKTAKYWLTALDVQGKESGEQIYVYFVQNGLAKDVADTINQVYGIQSTGTVGGRPDQQIVSSTGAGGRSAFGTSGASRSSFGSSSGSSGGSSFGRSSTGSSFGSSSSRTSSGLSGGTGGLSSSGLGSTSGSGGFSQRGRTTGGRTGGAFGAGGDRPSGLTGDVVIIADEVNNAIVVRANAIDYAKIKKTMETLDIVPRAVLIEVLVAEITLNKNMQYGLSWFFRDIGINVGGAHGTISGAFGRIAAATTTNTTSVTTTNTTSVPPTAQQTNGTGVNITDIVSNGLGIFGGTTDQSIGVLIDLLATKTNVNVLSTPTLLATDNKEATITVGGRQPIPTGSVTGADTGSNVISSIQYEETGIILTVTPHINAGGLVRLEVEQTIRNVGNNVTVGNGATAPQFTERNVKTTLLAQNGTTVVIGGIIDQRETNDKNGIPFLQDVPLISPLFSTTGKSKDRTELIIAITPHVVNHRESEVTREFLDKLKSLRGRIER